MPTGYTCPIADQEDISFSDFVLRCSRAMWVNIAMRDDPLDKPPPRVAPIFHGSTDYMRTAASEAREELERLEEMSIEDAEDAALEEHRQAWLRYDENMAAYHKECAVWDPWVDQTEAWEPPQRLQSLKEFMLDQLSASRPFPPTAPGPKMTGKEWIESTMGRCERRVNIYLEELERNDRNSQDAQQYLDVLWSEVDKMKESEDAAA